MNHSDDTSRILISKQAAQRVAATINRRRFLALGGGAAALAALAACGSSSSSNTNASQNSGGTEPKKFAKNLNMFTWAEYDDPDLLKSWGNISLTIFNSNEEAIQKLVQGGGSSGFDMVVPTGVYIPQLAKAGMLAELDKTRIPNFSNLDPAYANQTWDPGNKYLSLIHI